MIFNVKIMNCSLPKPHVCEGLSEPQVPFFLTAALGPDRKRGFLGYRGFYFSNFYKSVFSIFTCSEYRKLGSKISEIFKHPCYW